MKKTYYLVALLLLLGGVGCTQYPPLATKADLPSDYSYVIGPGDELDIHVWGDESASAKVPVRPDGKISTHLIDELQASGKTPKQLSKDIKDMLGAYIRDPLVTVVVTRFVGQYSQQIRVIGAFGGSGGGSGSSGGNGGGSSGGGISSGGSGSSSSFGSSGSGSGENILRAAAFPYVEGMTLLDLAVQIGELGGYYAAWNRASIVRMIDGKRQQFGVRMEDLIEDADISANVDLLPGDILFIPEAWF